MVSGVGLGLRSNFLAAVAGGKADGKVPFFEISPENYMHRGGRSRRLFEEVADRFPLLTHGLMMSLGGEDPFDSDYMDTLRDFTARFGGAWHSDHLCFSTQEGALLHDLLPVPLTKRSAAHLADRVKEAQDRVQRPMLIENISFYAHLESPEMDEADFVRAVAERADCGILLDVNNILVNGRNLGFDPIEMLAKYPIERVRQMHVAGHEHFERYDMLVDTHGATALPEVHRMMQWVIERRGPLPVVLERDANIPPLAALLEEVASLQSSYDEALGRFQEAPHDG